MITEVAENKARWLQVTVLVVYSGEQDARCGNNNLKPHPLSAA